MKKFPRIALLLLTVVVSGCAMNPVPLEDAYIDATATARLSRVAADQEPLPVGRPIDLYEAMARALKYNLDYKVEVMEQALRVEEMDLAKLDMLPKLVGNVGYVDRDNESGGRSLAIRTRRESLEPSTSIEREHTTSDLSLSWDVLDFGLSYVRAQQRGDDVMLAMEQRRKVANRIIEDVRTAYWRVASSDKLLRRLRELNVTVDDALVASEALEARQLTSPLDALSYQRELMSVKLQIQALHREFGVAKQQLAALINVPPGIDFDIAGTEVDTGVLDLTFDPELLVQEALRNRSELREIDYRMKINSWETTAALLEMLPGFRLHAGVNHESNDLLFNSNWLGWGAKVTWNLMNVFHYPQRKTKIEAQGTLLDQQALATAMAIMTQVHISLTRYEMIGKEYQSNEKFLSIQTKIDEKVTSTRNARRESQQYWIRERMNTVIAELKRDISYADLQNIYANIYASVGYDSFPTGVDGSESIAELSAALRDLWGQRHQPLAGVVE